MILLLDIKIFPILLILIGGAGTCFGISMCISLSKSLKNKAKSLSMPIVATIVDSKRNKSGSYAAVYYFKCGSIEVSVVGQYGSLTPYNQGANVEIMVDPNNPYNNSISVEKQKSIIMAFFMLLTIAFIGITLLGVSAIS